MRLPSNQPSNTYITWRNDVIRAQDGQAKSIPGSTALDFPASIDNNFAAMKQGLAQFGADIRSGHVGAALKDVAGSSKDAYDMGVLALEGAVVQPAIFGAQALIEDIKAWFTGS